jgi:tartrate dehydratase beta subunit/fumarate hydratase class I family protein
MTLVKDIRKTFTDTTPVYAAVGVTDLAVERLRDVRARATTRAAAVRVDLDITTMQDRAVKRFEKVTEQAQQIPVQFRSQTIEAAGKARVTYSGLAVRGEKLVKRIRNQKSTKDLIAQAGSTVSLGKGAVTTVRKAAQDTQRAAKVTLATGRREAGSVAASVQDSVSKAPAKVATVIEGTGTTTTAKKSTASAERATRSVATSARKTAAAATAAAKIATTKIGD